MKTAPRLDRLPRVALFSVLAMILAGSVLPASAQDNLAEARIRRMEAEIRALQRQVFPGGGKLFAPESATTGTATNAVAGQPATTPVTDMLARMEALEAQMQRLTAQVEENSNKLRQLEARVGPAPSAAAPAAANPAPTPAPAATPTPAASANLNAMTNGASTPKPAATPAPKPTAAASAAPAAPSAQRVAAVRAIVKPQTDDAGDDEYSYGFRLWEAKFYPEAQQQLKLMIDRYPRHSRISYAKNLMGRAYLDDGKAREAATWFLQNYQNNKRGERAPDSLLLLGEAMSRLKDTSRACIALGEFVDTYPQEAAGRLKSQYDSTRATVKCN